MNVRSLQLHFYPDPVFWDPIQRFLRVLSNYVQPTSHVLDLGAGAGSNNSYALKGKVKSIVGVDLDARVADNPLLDLGVIADICQLPFADNSFDIAFAIYVLEHLPDPGRFVRELNRVLRRAAIFLH